MTEILLKNSTFHFLSSFLNKKKGELFLVFDNKGLYVDSLVFLECDHSYDLYFSVKKSNIFLDIDFKKMYGLDVFYMRCSLL